MKGVRLPRNVVRVTFVESEESFIFDNFGEAIGDTIVGFVSGVLGLKPDLDDFEGLHDKDLGPA